MDRERAMAQTHRPRLELEPRPARRARARSRRLMLPEKMVIAPRRAARGHGLCSGQASSLLRRRQTTAPKPATRHVERVVDVRGHVHEQMGPLAVERLEVLIQQVGHDVVVVERPVDNVQERLGVARARQVVRLEDGIELAIGSIDSGRALVKLNELIDSSNRK